MTRQQPKRHPTRTCVACRTTRQKRELVRVVRRPDGVLVLDESGRLAGRGAYLCADLSCWSTALGRGAIQRALGMPLPEELRSRLETEAGAMTTNRTSATIEGNEGETIGTE